MNHFRLRPKFGHVRDFNRRDRRHIKSIIGQRHDRAAKSAPRESSPINPAQADELIHEEIQLWRTIFKILLRAPVRRGDQSSHLC